MVLHLYSTPYQALVVTLLLLPSAVYGTGCSLPWCYSIRVGHTEIETPIIPGTHKENEQLQWYRWRALYWAVDEGDELSTMRLLNDPQCQLINGVGVAGRTLLHRAAQKGHTQIARRLVESVRFWLGAAQDCHGRTALHYAAELGHADIVKVLTADDKHGVNDVDCYGRTAAHLAAQRGHIEIVSAILLKSHHTNVNAVDNRGRSLLHALAAVAGSAWVVQQLLHDKRFELVGALDSEKRTARDRALAAGNNDVAQLLTPSRLVRPRVGHYESFNFCRKLATQLPDEVCPRERREARNSEHASDTTLLLQGVHEESVHEWYNNAGSGHHDHKPWYKGLVTWCSNLPVAKHAFHGEMH